MDGLAAVGCGRLNLLNYHMLIFLAMGDRPKCLNQRKCSHFRDGFVQLGSAMHGALPGSKAVSLFQNIFLHLSIDVAVTPIKGGSLVSGCPSCSA